MFGFSVRRQGAVASLMKVRGGHRLDRHERRLVHGLDTPEDVARPAPRHDGKGDPHIAASPPPGEFRNAGTGIPERLAHRGRGGWSVLAGLTSRTWV